MNEDEIPYEPLIAKGLYEAYKDSKLIDPLNNSGETAVFLQVPNLKEEINSHLRGSKKIDGETLREKLEEVGDLSNDHFSYSIKELNRVMASPSKEERERAKELWVSKQGSDS